VDPTDQPTCGQGLAENAVLPAKLGELIASVAANLEARVEQHRKMLAAAGGSRD
jgi:hypothetical protein